MTIGACACNSRSAISSVTVTFTAFPSTRRAAPLEVGRCERQFIPWRRAHSVTVMNLRSQPMTGVCVSTIATREGAAEGDLARIPDPRNCMTLSQSETVDLSQFHSSF